MINHETGEILQSSFVHSENLNDLFGALAKVQANAVDLAKDQKGYSARYTYANLDQLLEKNREVWTNEGIAILFLPTPPSTSNKTAMRVLITHSSGQYISEIFEMSNETASGSGMSPQQAEGTVISYMRRYALMSILAIASEDPDGTTVKAETPRTETTHRNTAGGPPKSAPNETRQAGGQGDKATDKQVGYIKKLRAGGTPAEQKRIDDLIAKGMTKSEASAIIEHFKNKEAEENDIPDEPMPPPGMDDDLEPSLGL